MTDNNNNNVQANNKTLLERLTAKDPTLTEILLNDSNTLTAVLQQVVTNATNPHITTFDWTTTTTTNNNDNAAPKTVVTSATTQLLWQALETFPNLQHVVLQNCPTNVVTAQQARSLCQALNKSSSSSNNNNKQLQTLCLSNNPKLGPRGAKVLATELIAKAASAAAGSQQQLQVLDLTRTSMGHLGAQAIGLVLPLGLQQLRLGHNAVGHDGVWKLASPRLSQLQQLQQLDLSWNACLDDGCLEIARHLPQLKQLQSLSLAGNSITGTGLKGLARALLMNNKNQPNSSGSCLRKLDLSENCIHAAAIMPLAKVLASSSQQALEYLNLEGNQLQDAGCKALARGLVGGSLLASADQTVVTAMSADEQSEWDDDEEDEDGTMTSAAEEQDDEDVSSSHHTESSSKHVSSLRVLKLARNDIGDGGAGTFVELLDDMPNMRVLDLSDNPDVSEARIRILTMLLKHRQATPLTPRTPYNNNEKSSRRIVVGATSTAAAAAAAPENENNDNNNNIKAGPVTSHDLSSRLSVPFAPQVDDNEYTYLARDLDPQAIQEGREELLGLSFDEDHDDGTKMDTAVRVHLDYMHFLTDHFDTKHILSHGAFGALYPANQDEQVEDCELVVRRLCLGPAGALKTVRDSVLSELQDLRHKSLLPLLAMTTAGGPSHDTYCFLYNVTQLRPLRAFLEEKELRRTLVWKLRIEILLGVAQALVFLHGGIGPKRKPCFHGDVQPSNIFVGPSSSQWDLRVQLTDGGLGRLLATDRGRFASGDVVFGTRAYRCPRYERGSCHYDAASDMFSYGICLSEILTGCLQGSRTQKNTGMTNDFYYDNILLSNQQTTVKVDPLAGVLPRQAMEGLAQVGASCLSPVVIQRPAAHTVERILGQLKVE